MAGYIRKEDEAMEVDVNNDTGFAQQADQVPMEEGDINVATPTSVVRRDKTNPSALWDAANIQSDSDGTKAFNPVADWDPSLPYSDYKLTQDDLVVNNREIGHGSDSTVSHVTFKRGVFRGYTRAAAKRLYKVPKSEVKILKRLCHQNIVPFIAYIEGDLTCLLLTEYAEYGDLYDVLHGLEKPLSSAYISKWCYHLAMAVQYLHKEGVLHRDIKSRNCLIFCNGVLKLCDFGVSRETDVSITTTGERGTYRWMSPEAFRHLKHSKAGDVYSMGLVFLEMCTRNIPFHDYLPDESTLVVMYKVVDNDIKPNMPPNCPEYLRELLPKCWLTDRHKRPLISEVIKVIVEAMPSGVKEEILKGY